MNDLVSIVIPTYNASLYLIETLDSICKQTYGMTEVIIVDDGSTDETVEVIRGYQELHPECNVHIYEQEKNRGPAAARNRGVKEAKGRYLAFLDADDLWEPDKLEKQILFMKDYEVTFSCTSYEFANESGIGTGKIAHVPRQIRYKQAIKNTIIFTSTVCFDLNKITKEEITMPMIESEDTATWWKVLRSGHVVYGIDEVLVRYRRPVSSLSSNKLKAIRRIWNLYRRQEQFTVAYSTYCFLQYAVRTTLRRL